MSDDNSVNVPIEVAFEEACKALGESIVRERILTKMMAASRDES